MGVAGLCFFMTGYDFVRNDLCDAKIPLLVLLRPKCKLSSDVQGMSVP